MQEKKLFIALTADYFQQKKIDKIATKSELATEPEVVTEPTKTKIKRKESFLKLREEFLNKIQK